MNGTTGNRAPDRAYLVISVAVWIPLALGCIIGPGPGAEDVPPVQEEGCSDDHAEHWAPDPAGAQLSIGSPDAACNELLYYSGGGAQSATTFHIEPTLTVTNPDLEPPAEASVTWEILGLEGDPLREQGVEVYEDEIEFERDGFSVTSRVFIGPEMRGKNVRLRGIMEVVDATPADSSEGGADVDTTVTVSPETAVYITP